MKDFTQQELENSRPSIDTLEAIEFCLNKLYEDNTKLTSDYIVHNLIFEELIGALLLARDELKDFLSYEDDDKDEDE
ncbi:hypothetical protein [Chamaesiphon sp. OTE_75_metabat_556]|uniref:hypothetical protein n=1 Tax=Chamaesiphon sp. OTE_75_metabat_556 TaxID=2964692 RepID=UPI002869F3A1|nr:hypothetical protein [Chamaesiphon sp. OTE_75_metabat_556]